MNAGFVAAVRYISHHEPWPIEALDGVAPESIGPRGRADSARATSIRSASCSDLLAGRSPHARSTPSRDSPHSDAGHRQRPGLGSETSSALGGLGSKPSSSAIPASARLRGGRPGSLGRRPRPSRRSSPVETLPAARGGRGTSSVGRVAGPCRCAVLGLGRDARWHSAAPGDRRSPERAGTASAPDRLPARAPPHDQRPRPFPPRQDSARSRRSPTARSFSIIPDRGKRDAWR